MHTLQYTSATFFLVSAVAFRRTDYDRTSTYSSPPALDDRLPFPHRFSP